MNADDFVEGIKEAVLGSVASDCISTYENPPGKEPSAKLKELAIWYSTLSAEDKGKLTEALSNAAHTAIFGVLCVLDGVRPIGQTSNEGSFELHYVDAEGNRSVVVGPGTRLLHDLLNAV